MDISSNDTLQELIEEIKKMNGNLEATSFAINNLTMQLNKPTSVDSILPATESGIITDIAEASPCIDTLAHGDQETALGYVNWNESHDFLKDQHLVAMVHIRDAMEKLKKLSSVNMKVKSTNTKQVARYDYEEYDDEDDHNQDESKNNIFSFNLPIPMVGKENRFPQDAVYVDVNSPRIKEEMDFMNKLFVPPTEGVVDRFIKIVESEMQTCARFEKQHGLKWV